MLRDLKSATGDRTPDESCLKPNAGSLQCRYWGYGALCGLLVVVAVLACRPSGEIGYLDDWSTARTAQIFAQSGHFAYNGWEAATEGWQILWAALFIKLFGFSYLIVRLSLLPVVFATVFLFYQSLIRFGFTIGHTSFGALALGLSPLFLPTASSFMTDIPALMVTLLCLVLCQKAVAQREDRALIFWLAVAALTVMVGGTVRQTAFLGVLLMIPSVGWWQRKRHGVWRAGLAMTAIGSVWVFLFLRWFHSQPYSVPESILVPLNAATLAHLFGQLFSALFFLFIGVLPVLAYFLPAFLQLPRKIFWGIYASIACLVLITMGTANVSAVGVVLRKFKIDLSLSITAVVLAGVALLFIILRALSKWRVEEKRNFLFLCPQTKPWHHIFWLLGPFSLGYFLLLLPRGATGWIWDRYLLGLTPVAIVCIMKVYQDRIGLGVPKIAMIFLALLGCFGVAKADRRYSENRAILKAANILRSDNIPRTQITGGFEYDSETQLDVSGYVNEPKLKVPAGAYHPYMPPPGLPRDLADLSYTPAIVPKYFILDARNADLAQTKYPPVEYTTLLPPFRRKLYILQLRAR